MKMSLKVMASYLDVPLLWVQRLFSIGLNSVLNVKALVGAFNQEKALVGAFSVIMKTGCGTDGALHSTSSHLAAQLDLEALD